MYQLMKDICDVLDELGIRYWADSGTLLGLIRCKGFIAWDNDLDLVIMEEDMGLFDEKAAPIFKKLGFKVKGKQKIDNEHQGRYRSIRNLDLVIENCAPKCDIFFIRKEERGAYSIPYWTHTYQEKDLFPLKRYPFGQVPLWGPAHPVPFLKSVYGKNWDTQAYSNGFLFFLNAQRNQPASPMGPLENKREQIKQWIKELESSSPTS